MECTLLYIQGDIVDAILDDGNETVESFSEALSLTVHHSLPEKAGGCHRPMKSRLNTLKRFVHGVSHRHFIQTSERVRYVTLAATSSLRPGCAHAHDL